MTKALEKLSEDELERWLTCVNLNHLISKLKQQAVTAEILSACESVQELVEYGVPTGHARVLMKRVEEARGEGVQLSVIAPSLSTKDTSASEPQPSSTSTDAPPPPVPAQTSAFTTIPKVTRFTYLSSYPCYTWPSDTYPLLNLYILS